MWVRGRNPCSSEMNPSSFASFLSEPLNYSGSYFPFSSQGLTSWWSRMVNITCTGTRNYKWWSILFRKRKNFIWKFLSSSIHLNLVFVVAEGGKKEKFRSSSSSCFHDSLLFSFTENVAWDLISNPKVKIRNFHEQVRDISA